MDPGFAWFLIWGWLFVLAAIVACICYIVGIFCLFADYKKERYVENIQLRFDIWFFLYTLEFLFLLWLGFWFLLDVS